MKTWLVITLNLLATLALLAAYHRYAVPPPLRFGVVDLQAVYDAEMAQYVRRFAAETDAAGRRRVELEVGRFSRRLGDALDSLPRDCHCVVISKGVLFGQPGPTADLTPMLRQRLKP